MQLAIYSFSIMGVSTCSGDQVSPVFMKGFCHTANCNYIKTSVLRFVDCLGYIFWDVAFKQRIPAPKVIFRRPGSSLCGVELSLYPGGNYIECTHATLHRLIGALNVIIEAYGKTNKSVRKPHSLLLFFRDL